MKIGVTGSNGFIGSHVLNHLNSLKIDYVPIDLRELENFNNSKLFDNLDWIFHFAAKTNIPKSIEESDEIYANNILSTSKALTLSKMTNSSLLFLSSYVYGVPNYLPIDEEHDVNPTNSYINSKLICEKLCEDQMVSSNKSLIILRCFNIYGFDSNAGRLIHDIIYSAKNEKKIIINDSIPKRDYLYIDDFCDLINKIITNKKIIQNIFNVGFGKSYSNIEIAEYVKDLMNISNRIKVENKPRANDLEEIIADISLISETFNWSPRIGIREGLKATLNQLC